MKKYNLLFLLALFCVLTVFGVDAHAVSFYNLKAKGVSTAGYSSDLYPTTKPSDVFNLPSNGGNNLFVQSSISQDVNGWGGNVGHVDASSSLSIEQECELQDTPFILASYSFYEHVFNGQSTYGLMAQTYSNFDFVFSMDTSSKLYWAIKWNTSPSPLSTDAIKLPSESYINFAGTPSGTSFGSQDLNIWNNTISFNFNTHGGGLMTGAGDYTSSGNMQFAFSTQPFNEFPIISESTPEPATMFLLGSVMLGMFGMKNIKK